MSGMDEAILALRAALAEDFADLRCRALHPEDGGTCFRCRKWGGDLAFAYTPIADLEQSRAAHDAQIRAEVLAPIRDLAEEWEQEGPAGYSIAEASQLRAAMEAKG